MSEPINDGGPAFPIPIAGCTDGAVYNVLEQSGGRYGGMSLRDWFAGQALAGEMASQSPETGEWTNGVQAETLEARARMFYRFADAMLKAREVRP